VFFDQVDSIARAFGAHSYPTTGGAGFVAHTQGGLVQFEQRRSNGHASREPAFNHYLASFDDPLDFGLTLSLRSSPDLATFAGTFEYLGDEPDRVSQLLGPEVQALSVEAAGLAQGGWAPFTRSDSSIHVNDSGISLTTGRFDSVTALVPLLGNLRARLRWHAGNIVPPSQLVNVAATFQMLGRETGLAYRNGPVSLVGTNRGFRCCARVIRTGTFSYSVELIALAPQSLRLGLKLDPPVSRLERWTMDIGGSRSPIDIADPEFSARFSVLADDPVRATQVLGPDARRRLIQLSRFGRFSVSDTAIVVPAPALLATPEQTLSGLAEVVDALSVLHACR
jgi:hypothetical protein